MNLSMKILRGLTPFLIAGILAGCGEPAVKTEEEAGSITLVIHGGAGTIKKEEMTEERERAYREKLTEALLAGFEILETGGTSIDAVEATILIMEDSPLFNAGKGSVFTHQGKNEMDAAIMNGADLQAGAVTSVTTIKNPIRAARAVMEQTKHVLLAGRGAELFAAEHGLEFAPPDYFFTQRRWDALLKAKEKDATPEPERPADWRSFGTVGAVALDSHGNLAAATSTGGLTNKLHGRVGDTPIVGAGTYANNKTCAVSGTGQGEFFMRNLVAYDVSAFMEHGGLPLKEAADKVVHEKLIELGGEGGIIALDRQGNFAMPFNTLGMYRGYIQADGEARTFIYPDE